MSKGILYVMTTVVPGLITIGTARVDSFESEMNDLERNGYANVTGLKRYYAIEVDAYDKKAQLLHEIFSNSKVPNTKLFALDADLVVQLLSSFNGKQIYPDATSKKNPLQKGSRKQQLQEDWDRIPDGVYYLSEYIESFGRVEATMRVEGGSFIVQKNSICVPVPPDIWIPKARRNAQIQDNILQADVPCNSPSTAGRVILGRRNNGWAVWKDEKGRPIDFFRKVEKDND